MRLLNKLGRKKLFLRKLSPALQAHGRFRRIDASWCDRIQVLCIILKSLFLPSIVSDKGNKRLITSLYKGSPSAPTRLIYLGVLLSFCTHVIPIYHAKSTSVIEAQPLMYMSFRIQTPSVDYSPSSINFRNL
jgi:hypothetical protein